jgi:hypothetical protein
MSETPQQGGWWQASDGLWYPPETHPAVAAGGPPTTEIPVDRTPPEGIPRHGPRAPAGRGRRHAPPVAPPGPRGAPPVPERRRSGSGCLVAFLLVVAIVVLGGFAIRAIVNQVREEASSAYDRTIGDAVDGIRNVGQCQFLTGDEAQAVLGESKVVGLGALSSGVPQLDTRVLPNAPSCLVAATNGRIARVARQQSDGAAAAFDAEAAQARAGDSPYHAGAVRGLRDEAFCTTLDGTGAAGVLLRRGDVLVYASVTPDLARNPGGVDKLGSRVAADNCRTAQALARRALT